MALVLKLSTGFSNNCKTIVIYDETGDSDAGSWGVGGNPAISTVLTATLGVRLPDGTVIAPISVYPTLPNVTGLGFNLTNVLMGLQATTLIQSGAYVFDYVVTGDDGSPYTYSTSVTKFLACAECCCRDKYAAKVSACGGNCGDVSYEQYSQLWDDIELMQNAASCGHINEANEFLLKVQLVCAQIDCNCT